MRNPIDKSFLLFGDFLRNLRAVRDGKTKTVCCTLVFRSSFEGDGLEKCVKNCRRRISNALSKPGGFLNDFPGSILESRSRTPQASIRRSKSFADNFLRISLTHLLQKNFGKQVYSTPFLFSRLEPPEGFAENLQIAKNFYRWDFSWSFRYFSGYKPGFLVLSIAVLVLENA